MKLNKNFFVEMIVALWALIGYGAFASVDTIRDLRNKNFLTAPCDEDLSVAYSILKHESPSDVKPVHKAIARLISYDTNDDDLWEVENTCSAEDMMSIVDKVELPKIPTIEDKICAIFREYDRTRVNVTDRIFPEGDDALAEYCNTEVKRFIDHVVRRGLCLRWRLICQS